MDQTAAVWQLTVASAAARVGGPFVSGAVDGAINALVFGLDGSSLRELAGMSRSSRSEDVRELLPGALADAGVSPSPSEDEALLITLRALAIETLLGWIPVRQLTSWAHDAIGHLGVDAAQSIVMLDDELDLAEQGIRSTVEPRIVIEGFLIATKPFLDRFSLPAGA